MFGTFAARPEHRNNPDAFKQDEITAGIQNIFDTRYFPNTLNGYNMPGVPGGTNAGNAPPELQTGPGRTFKVGASVKF